MRRPRFQLKDSVCLVTGASSGIGHATARLLADAGAQLVLQGRNESALNQLADETGGAPVALDLTAPGAADILIAEAKRLRGHVDVLVNNAGVGWAGSFSTMPTERIDSLITLNLHAPIALTHMLLPDMISANKGRIVFVASIAGHLGVRDEAVYSATKGALIAFAESLRSETCRTGVAVSVVSPGVIDTPFFSRRGRPYTRRWPRPLPAQIVAKAICTAIEEGRAETTVPSGLRAAIGVKALFPSLYRTLADRFA